MWRRFEGNLLGSYPCVYAAGTELKGIALVGAAFFLLFGRTGFFALLLVLAAIVNRFTDGKA